MRRIENLIRFQNADSSVAFRERAYGPEEDEALLRDVMAMANAEVKGPRLILMGIRGGASLERQVMGLDAEALSRVAHYKQLVSAFIDPPVGVDVRRIEMDGVSVGILMISHCDDPPYLMKQDFSSELRKGQGWIRSGTEQTRLTRIPMQRMFQRKFAGSATPDVEVGFPGGELIEEITLPVLALNQMPSEIAIQRIKRLLDSKAHANKVLGRDDSRIDRLMHTQLFGTDAEYRKQSADTLEIKLANARKDHAAADHYYEFELRAHKLNLMVRNLSDTALENASLTLRFVPAEGLSLSERLHAAPGAPPPSQKGYPTVQSGSRAIEVQARIGKVPARSAVKVFGQPLRLLLREAMTGRTIPIHYAVHGKNLPEPITGELRIRAVVRAKASAVQAL